MANLQHRLVECYVFIDDYPQSHSDLATWRQSNNNNPDFTDAEVITIALMQCYFLATGMTGEPSEPWLYDEAQTLRVMPSDEDKEGLSAVSQVRQRVESNFSTLWHRFADRVYSRSWRGLWTSLLLKILGFNMERAGIIATA